MAPSVKPVAQIKSKPQLTYCDYKNEGTLSLFVFHGDCRFLDGINKLNIPTVCGVVMMSVRMHTSDNSWCDVDTGKVLQR